MRCADIQFGHQDILRSPTRSLFVVGTFAVFSIGLAWLNGVYDNLISSTIATGGHIRVLSKNYYAKEMTFPIEEHLPQVDVISNSILDSNNAKNQSPIVSHNQARVLLVQRTKTSQCLLRLHHQRTIGVNSFLKVAVNLLYPIVRVSRLVQKCRNFKSMYMMNWL